MKAILGRLSCSQAVERHLATNCHQGCLGGVSNAKGIICLSFYPSYLYVTGDCMVTV